VRDGFADHLREYYVGETSKSMKVGNGISRGVLRFSG
jgi:hypothetical protein